MLHINPNLNMVLHHNSTPRPHPLYYDITFYTTSDGPKPHLLPADVTSYANRRPVLTPNHAHCPLPIDVTSCA